jgi:capsular exopolysaccharide synthesis family protein
VASLRRLLDNSVKNEDDLTGTPLLAAVGFDAMADEKPLITQIGRYAARTEAFRTIRTNLQYIRPDSPPKVIVVTSALPGEGKTTSAMNLALSLSQAGSKTLLIEADLRRPKISIYMEFSAKASGLTEILASAKSITPLLLKKNIHRYDDSKLDVLPAGVVPPNPSELLASHRFDKLITVLRKKYKYIIIDCPPLLPVTDAAIVSARVDGSILVIHAGVTKKPQFTGARDAMLSVGSTILGVILNMIPESSLEYEYGYRYGYPRYYGNHYLPYGSKKETVAGYEPRAEDLSRIEREDSFQHIKGKRFKEELMKDANPGVKSGKKKI